MAIYLIVGQPRHGKSQFSVKFAHDYHEKNLKIQKKIESGKFDESVDIVREIYSDIAGHADNCEFIKLAPADWRDVPDDSIIFMDEIHLRPEYCDSDGKMSQNQMIVDLTTHGHQNKDIFLITQDPERLNKGIRKLVEKMFLVKRPAQKPPFSTIYEFDRWLRDPWQAVSSTRSVHYHDSYKFLYNKKWQNMYVSASAHTSISFKIQKKFIFAFIAIILLFSASYFLFKKSGGDKIFRSALVGLKVVENSELQVNENTSEAEVQADNSLGFNNVQPALETIDLNRRPRKYQSIYEDEVADVLKISGCVETKNDCKCFDQHFNRFNISNKKCLSYLKTGYL